MLSKNRIKQLSSLSLKKFRETAGIFIAEGEKTVSEILFSASGILEPIELLATEEYIGSLDTKKVNPEVTITEVDGMDLKKISSLYAPNKAALLIKIPSYKMEHDLICNSLSLALENIRDPGNLGTIIRTADWFGIRDIFCSNESVDTFNPKTIQSTMGAIARVRVHYTDLYDTIKHYRETYNHNVTGALLNGDEIGSKSLPDKGIIVFGNESHGISENLRSLFTGSLKIPSWYTKNETSESLNIASSVAILCWEARRTSGIHSK